MIPHFEAVLTTQIKVERTLGGGKSGAFLFVVKLKDPNTGRFSTQNFVLKMYVNAYNSLGKVQDTRPFREVYTQCAMSGTVGYNCLLGFATIDWENVTGLFALQTDMLYDDKFKRVKADGRAIEEPPTRVLFMITNFSEGESLLNLDLHKYGHLMPGVFLNIMSIHQKAERRLGQFTHWDLHADNIFVDTKCTSRSDVPLALVTEFDPLYLYNKTIKIYNNADDIALFWEDLLNKKDKVLTEFRKTGSINEVPWYNAARFNTNDNEKLNDVYFHTCKQFKKDFEAFLNRKISYPNVTLIDFDLANSDQFPELEAVHKQKMKSPLPIAERTLTWLLKWIPAATVMRLMELLLIIRVGLPPLKQSDILHMIVYITVALIYWELNDIDRMAALHERGNFILMEIDALTKKHTTVTFEHIKDFFTSSLQSTMFIKKCPGALYCAIAPVIPIKYVNLSTFIMNWLCLESNTTIQENHTGCQVGKALQKASGVFEKTTVTHLMDTIHAALLTLNIDHYQKNNRFVTPDDVSLSLVHTAHRDTIYVDLEVPWAKIKNIYFPEQDLSWISFSRWKRAVIISTIESITQGVFSLGITMQKDTTVDISLKNGADLQIHAKTNMSLDIYASKAVGNKYMLQITTAPSKIREALLQIIITDLKLTKVGSITEIDINMQLNAPAGGLDYFGSITFIIKWLFARSAPGNAKISKGSNNNVRVILSLPPSDEPLHPCLGLLLDATNINMGLDCISSVISTPSKIGQLLAKLKDINRYVRMFLNVITASIKADNVAIPIWSNQWTADSTNWGMFTVEDTEKEVIGFGLRTYLQRYKGVLSDEQFNAMPETAQEYYKALLSMDKWTLLDINPKNFNLNYVEYLTNFLTDKFYDSNA